MLTLNQVENFLRTETLGPWSHRVFSNFRTEVFDPIKGLLVVTIVVTEELSNGGGALHGGAIATIIDVLTTAILLAADLRPSVTIDLHTTCISAAQIGDDVTIEARIDNIGKSIQFSSCRLFTRLDTDTDSDNVGKEKLVATGLHTKKVIGTRLGNFFMSKL